MTRLLWIIVVSMWGLKCIVKCELLISQSGDSHSSDKHLQKLKSLCWNETFSSMPSGFSWRWSAAQTEEGALLWFMAIFKSEGPSDACRNICFSSSSSSSSSTSDCCWTEFRSVCVCVWLFGLTVLEQCEGVRLLRQYSKHSLFFLCVWDVACSVISVFLCNVDVWIHT